MPVLERWQCKDRILNKTSVQIKQGGLLGLTLCRVTEYSGNELLVKKVILLQHYLFGAVEQ